MAKAKLVVTSHFLDPVESRTRKEYEIPRYLSGSSSGTNDLSAPTIDTDSMLVTPNDRLDAKFFSRMSSTHMGRLCLDNIEAVLRGMAAPSLVNLEAL